MPLDATCPHNLFRHEGWQRTLVQLYSFSKSYCMPGHRLGAVTAGADFILELAKIIDNIQICAPRAAQMAVTPMLTALTDWRQANRERIAARATLFEDVIHSLDGWELLSTGAYFGYVQHPHGGDEASLDVARRLAREVGVLTIPGTFFGDGQEDFLRFAFANAGRDVIAELPDRLTGF